MCMNVYRGPHLYSGSLGLSLRTGMAVFVAVSYSRVTKDSVEECGVQ